MISPTLYLAKKAGGIANTSKACSNRRGRDNKCSSSQEIPENKRRKERRNKRGSIYNKDRLE